MGVSVSSEPAADVSSSATVDNIRVGDRAQRARRADLLVRILPDDPGRAE